MGIIQTQVIDTNIVYITIVSIIAYFISGIFIALLAIVLNNEKSRLNCLGLETKKLFQEFFLLSAILPLVGLTIIAYRYISYIYELSYQDALNEYNQALLDRQH